MRLPFAAVVLGVTMGVFCTGGTYLAVTFLPGPLQLVMPVLALGLPMALLWPHWFDPVPAGAWVMRAVRRLTVVAGAAIIAGALGLAIVTALPGYISWSEGVHRASLERSGKTPEEIEQAVAAHRQVPSDFFLEGAMLTAMPGFVATLVTAAASAVVFRRRPLRP